MIDGTGDDPGAGRKLLSLRFRTARRRTRSPAPTAGETVLIEDWANNEFRALVRLDAYCRPLSVRHAHGGRLDPRLLDETQETVRLYHQLETERGRLLFEFGLLYLGFALILILAAVWLGLWFAERLSRPVGRLAGAAQRVGRRRSGRAGARGRGR